jgi:hypothetical protein
VSYGFLFYAGLGVQEVPSNKRWAFFTIGIIYSDLNKEQKGLVNNYYSM